MRSYLSTFSLIAILKMGLSIDNFVLLFSKWVFVIGFIAMPVLIFAVCTLHYFITGLSESRYVPLICDEVIIWLSLTDPIGQFVENFVHLKMSEF